jgi:hypothetical protein
MHAMTPNLFNTRTAGSYIGIIYQIGNVRLSKVSPDSSPKVSPDGQFGGYKGALRSVERAVEKAACTLIKQG